MSFYDDASVVLLPSGGAGKDGKTYSIKPTDGSGDFTFSRGANLSATRIDSNGLIEKGRENLLFQSNQFDTTWSNNLGGSGTIADNQSGYDGSNDAWLLTKDATTFARVQQTLDTPINGVWTMSAYLKAGTATLSRFRFNSASYMVEFNFSTGVATDVGSVSAINYGMTNVGNGWYRCYATFNASVSIAQIYVDYNTSTSTTMFIQDAQLEIGLTSTDYIESGASSGKAGLLENEPRFDYSDGASCPCVLMEPARTNKITQSEWLGGWSSSDVTLDFGYLSPDGTNNAYKVTANGSQPYIVGPAAGTIQPTDARTIYAKTTSGTGTAHLMTHNSNTNNLFTITNEWQRFEIKSVTTTTGQNNFYGVDLRGSSSLTEILIWGAQCEEHPEPTAEEPNSTSYIPTYGTSVSRAYDQTSELTYDDDLTSVVLFGEITMADVVRDSSYFVVNMRKGSGSGNRLFVYRNNSTSKRRATLYRQNNSGVNTFITEATTDRIKFAMQYNASNGSIKAYVNGANALASPVFDSDYVEFVKFQLSGQGGTVKIHQFAALKATYTNDELATLTSLI